MAPQSSLEIRPFPAAPQVLRSPNATCTVVVWWPPDMLAVGRAPGPTLGAVSSGIIRRPELDGHQSSRHRGRALRLYSWNGCWGFTSCAGLAAPPPVRSLRASRYLEFGS